MGQHYQVVIVGSGPGGLSAAVTAARNGLSHVLLERTDHLSDTIYKYQKGKAVMAHPLRLPLQAELPFEASNREAILTEWDATAQKAGVNVIYRAEVTGIMGQQGAFEIAIAGGETVTASQVVLGIGLQGNLRQMGVPGQDRNWVQYQLDDPDEYHNERIVVVGAGDAGIENAMALLTHNQVTLVNRQREFASAKPGNVAAAERAIRLGKLRCYHAATSARVEDDGLVLNTPTGEVKVACDRIIARLGAIPPRKFVESCGIKFPSKDPAAVPELSATYESNVPGLYIIGALGGYTLIKQAINQGYEVIQRIGGHAVQPADEPLLAKIFEQAFPDRPVNDVLDILRQSVPNFSGLTTLQLREVMLDSLVHKVGAGATIFNRGDYTSSLYNIVDGEVRVVLNEAAPQNGVRIGSGEFFGELGLISGRRRTAKVVASKESLLVETPRRSILRLESSVQAVQEVMDSVAVRRLVHTTLARDLPVGEIEDVIARAELKRYKAQEVLIEQGQPCDALYIIRSGSVTVTRINDGVETPLGYIGAGGMVGERGLLDDGAMRAATVRTTIASEAIRLDGDAIRGLMEAHPELRHIFQVAVQKQFDATIRSELSRSSPSQAAGEETGVISFLVSQGIGEATNAFIIDEALCVRCDNCETACASTHGGISRVQREAGSSFAAVHLPIACRHCENPHCMADCPVDAITRAPTGEVFIDDKCIGCANCSNNCPYGVISMVDLHERKRPGLVGWFLASLGLSPKPESHAHDDQPHRKIAVKCDLCKDVGGGPACVRACPTGAAIRVSPDDYMSRVREGLLPNKVSA